jgi:hypothetical protein
MLRRRRARTDAVPRPDLGVRVISVASDDARTDAELAAARERAWGKVRAIVAEAVIRQDQADELLAAIRRREPLNQLAPRGGPLVRRFFELRDELPDSDDPELNRITAVLAPVLHHHALMVNTSLDMLACDWRSERLVFELERISGLGAPAEGLERIRERLVAAG